MARTQETIWQAMVADYTATILNMFGRNISPTSFLPSNWSMYNMEGAIFWILAGGIAVFEQIFDNYVATIETAVASASPQTNLWWQNFVLNVFQYNATTPQILTFNTATANYSYSIVNAAYNIVTQCAVVPGNFGVTKVLVATGGTSPVPLSTGVGSQLSALQSTLNTLTVPGININAVSIAADNLFIGATVLFDGNYDGTVQITVPAAVNAYLRSIPTSGIVSPNSPIGLMKLNDLIAAVRAVPGVIDIQLNNVNARISTATFPPATYNMVNNNTWITDEYNSGLSAGSGWLVTESTAGYLITESITYNAQ